MMSIVSTNCVAILSVHTTMRKSSLGNLSPSPSRHPPTSWLTLLWTTLPSNMPGNKSPTAPKWWTLSAMDKWWVAHTSHNSNGHTPSAPSKDCPNCTWQHRAGRASCPAHDSSCSKCDKMGHWGPNCHGGKPLQPRNAPPPGSQQRKSRCPPRNHHNCQGQSHKQTP